MQCACTILSSVAFPVVQYFCTLPQNSTIFRQKVIEHKMRVSSFCANLCETFLILRRIKRYMIKNVHRSFILLYFNETETFSTDFPKFSNSKFHKNPSSGNRVVPHGLTDEQTDSRQTDRHDEADSHFSHFSQRPWKLFPRTWRLRAVCWWVYIIVYRIVWSLLNRKVSVR
jgi:hypothetical protein